jgi:hypothetical protein
MSTRTYLAVISAALLSGERIARAVTSTWSGLRIERG